jgi:response regulator RpfG family c-di-GMP phosphodiesterase
VTAPLLPVLCVDDEPRVVDGIARHLKRHYLVLSATSGAEALAILDQEPNIAVILSDLRMPGMSGTALLARARELRPEAVRILLTGQGDLDAAVAAINDGQVFRFLTKPCATTVLLAAFAAAADQHRLISGERILLQETLKGSIKVLTDVLALTNPASFGRASRIKQLAIELSEELGVKPRWQLEVAAMLSQLGIITLPAETAEKVYFGLPLTMDEQVMVDRVPKVTEGLLGNIPRLEGVRAILARIRGDRPSIPEGNDAPLLDHCARLLRLAFEYDQLETQGTQPGRAIDVLRSRGRHPADALDALAKIRSPDDAGEGVRELPLSSVRIGMVIAEDVRMVNGALLAARGFEVTQSFVDRAENFGPEVVRAAIRVVVRHESIAAV